VKKLTKQIAILKKERAHEEPATWPPTGNASK